jgi:hypothetical protein
MLPLGALLAIAALVLAFGIDWRHRPAHRAAHAGNEAWSEQDPAPGAGGPSGGFFSGLVHWTASSEDAPDPSAQRPAASWVVPSPTPPNLVAPPEPRSPPDPQTTTPAMENPGGVNGTRPPRPVPGLQP